ncbi:hypothetical protein F0562_002937 [Nyssa sinensis]|uniref:Protein kinase domain-containing protein n=1 Tax=Nyssa sinensis TaxID=561372 RepID=A0A5J5BUL9_9ASTE|nr:hypothetical protein F0562_002937 [Nyssa sinensis]
MALHEMLVQLITLLIAILSARAIAATSQPKPGCPTNCGNLSIPFPFGTSDGCYLDDSFFLTCNDIQYNPPRTFAGDEQVLDISVNGHMRVASNFAQDCFNKSGLLFKKSTNFSLPNFVISSTRNKFTAVGCDTIGVAAGVGSEGQNYAIGCVSFCNLFESVDNGSCSGFGCCQTSMPQGATEFAVVVGSIWNHANISDFNPCGYAFLVEEDYFNFSNLDLKDFQNRENVPMVLDWAIGNETCEEAKKNSSSYACRAVNSDCYNSPNGLGYFCNCSGGYQGNPYLIDDCQDIDECEISNPCVKKCKNLPGNFSCPCPEGYDGDGRKDGTGCQYKGSILLNVSLGLSISLLVLVVGSSWIYWIVKKRKHMKLKEKFFLQNGGLMFQQQLSRHEGSIETAKIFTIEDLKKATKNYDESKVIGRGGFGTVYKGVLPDNTVVAIKKSKISDQNQIEQFINEVIVLSQINHRNVVKLLGCCLETEVPLLVYEFITNGTLSYHIHNEGRATSLSWEMRLKIAAETAGAIAYLHSAASTPIIHRDIKSTNILLDDNYTAKVADFGASKLVPVDQAQLTTLVQGTFGYLDPEYFHSSQLTEKSDVYSFGVLLAELLTGEMALSFVRPEKDRNLAMYFDSLMEEGRLFQILDHRPVNEGKFEQLKEVAELARRCLRVKREERPTMKEVAMELEGLRVMEKHPWVNVNLYPEETELLLAKTIPSDGYNNGEENRAQLKVEAKKASILNKHELNRKPVELELFDIIAQKGSGAHISSSEIVSQLPAQNPDAASILDRMLCLLASYSLLTCSLRTHQDGTVERLYGLAPAGKFFVRNQSGRSLASMFPFAYHPPIWTAWFHLKDAILEGDNIFKKACGMSVFQFMNADPTFNSLFNKSMADMSNITMLKLLETYKGFEGLGSLVDVGGGIGTSLNMIISKYPFIKGINYDLPHVIQSAPSYPGIEHVGGDMFVSIPKGEAIMVKNVFHNWNDERCLKLLHNCYEALPKKGKVIIIDFVMPLIPEQSTSAKVAALMDITMLNTPSGKERTVKEFEALCKGARFSDFNSISSAHAFGVIEFLK